MRSGGAGRAATPLWPAGGAPLPRLRRLDGALPWAGHALEGALDAAAPQALGAALVRAVADEAAGRGKPAAARLASCAQRPGDLPIGLGRAPPAVGVVGMAVRRKAAPAQPACGRLGVRVRAPRRQRRRRPPAPLAGRAGRRRCPVARRCQGALLRVGQVPALVFPIVSAHAGGAALVRAVADEAAGRGKPLAALLAVNARRPGGLFAVPGRALPAVRAAAAAAAAPPRKGAAAQQALGPPGRRRAPLGIAGGRAGGPAPGRARGTGDAASPARIAPAGGAACPPLRRRQGALFGIGLDPAPALEVAAPHAVCAAGR